jgi:hypothetical protein
MTKTITELYVIAINTSSVWNDCVYDFKTAQSVCGIAKDSGYVHAEVITLAYAIKNGYSF